MPRRAPSLAFGLVLAGVLSSPAAAQREVQANASSEASGDAVSAFIARARAATERYKDQNVAAADGYRPLGPDFPAMGVHWANGELVVKGEFDAARPGLLTYANINGVPTLTGVVYALPLADNELPPAFPFDRSLWHDHLGTVEEESLLLTHDGAHGATGGLRLAVLHAWIWIENPAGTFVTDNWALPYARLGVRAAAHGDDAAARALSFLTGARSYYVSLAEQTAKPTDAERTRIEATLAAHQSAIADWWKMRTPNAEASAADIDKLNAMWKAMWSDVERSVGPATAARLRRIWQP